MSCSSLFTRAVYSCAVMGYLDRIDPERLRDKYEQDRLPRVDLSGWFRDLCTARIDERLRAVFTSNVYTDEREASC